MLKLRQQWPYQELCFPDHSCHFNITVNRSAMDLSFQLQFFYFILLILLCFFNVSEKSRSNSNCDVVVILKQQFNMHGGDVLSSMKKNALERENTRENFLVIRFSCRLSFSLMLLPLIFDVIVLH